MHNKYPDKMPKLLKRSAPRSGPCRYCFIVRAGIGLTVVVAAAFRFLEGSLTFAKWAWSSAEKECIQSAGQYTHVLLFLLSRERSYIHWLHMTYGVILFDRGSYLVRCRPQSAWTGKKNLWVYRRFRSVSVGRLHKSTLRLPRASCCPVHGLPVYEATRLAQYF